MWHLCLYFLCVVLIWCPTLAMSWQSPGSGDGRRSRDTSLPGYWDLNSPSEEDKLDANAPSFTSQQQQQSRQQSQAWSPVRQQQQPRHQVITSDDLGETSFPRGGINSPQQSRLMGYTFGPGDLPDQHAGRRTLPQSYQSDLHQSSLNYTSYSQSYSRREIPAFGHNIDEQYHHEQQQQQQQQQQVHQQVHQQSHHPQTHQQTPAWSYSQSQIPSPSLPSSASSSLHNSPPSSFMLGWQQHQQSRHQSQQQQQQHEWASQTSISPPPISLIRSSQQHTNLFRQDSSSHPQLPQPSAILPSISSMMAGAGQLPSSNQQQDPQHQHQFPHSLFSYSSIIPGEGLDHSSPAISFDTSLASMTQSTNNPNTTSSSTASIADDLKSPLPQNLRGDPFRSAKVKTELCRYFNTSKGCIFGDKCNYAHGEQELKFNKLIDLEMAGLVDVEVFRTHPCFTWVATGACPFDQRCTRLHDPRVNGIQPSWLPHAEVLVNNVGRGMHVDKLYHQQYCAVYSCSPVYGFAPERRWNPEEGSTKLAWKEFYSFCSNMEDSEPYSKGVSWPVSSQNNEDSAISSAVASSKGSSANAIPEISEIHRLAMALKMRDQRKSQYYTYLPSHVFCGELCMVLQMRYFRLEVVEVYHNFKRYHIIEITEQESERARESGQDSNNIIIAREIAFGPVADASVRPASIWFNVSSEDIIPCTRQQARRHKRSRHRLRMKRSYESQPEELKITNCCSIPPFYCCQPVDEAVFDLITDIQTHRYRVLDYFSSSPKEQVLQSLSFEEEQLQKRFESQRQFWMTWTWPKKMGSNDIDDDTDVPPVDGAYNFVTYGDRGYGEDSLFFGFDQKHAASPVPRSQIVSEYSKLATGLIWKSFIMNLQLQSDRGGVEVPAAEEKMPTHDQIVSRIHRLPILRALSLGKPIVRDSASRTLPTLINEYCSSTGVNLSLDVLIREWTALQLQYEENSSNPLREAQIGKDTPPDPTQRRALSSYDFDVTARSWTRELPKYS